MRNGREKGAIGKIALNKNININCNKNKKIANHNNRNQAYCREAFEITTNS